MLKQIDRLRLENGDLQVTLMAVTSAKNLAEKRYNRSEEQRIAALASVAALTPKPPTEEQEAFKEAHDALKQQTLDAKRTGEMENAAEMAKLIDS